MKRHLRPVRLSHDLVARMYLDYEQLGSMTAAAKVHGRTAGTLFQIFRRRNLPVLPDRSARVAKTRRAHLDGVVAQMHAEYEAGATLNGLARKYGGTRGRIAGLFQVRGLAIRPYETTAAHDPRTGQILPGKVHTWAEVEEIVSKETRLRVPPELKREWRKWPMEKRGQYIALVRERLQLPSRPSGPFSENVTPFDYTTAAAREIMDRKNAGLNSRDAVCKIDVCSQGVIYDGELWFWSAKAGYQLGVRWTPEHGRPSLHHVIWEEENGPVPDGFVVRMKDGNPNNLTTLNMWLASRDTVCRENQATALMKKSREQTAVLLSRNQRKEKDDGLIEAFHATRRGSRSAAAGSR